MAKKKSNIRFTYGDYQSLEWESKRYELLDGELIMVPSPSFDHQKVVARLFFYLGNTIEKKQLGLLIPAPLDTVFGEGDDREVVQPDLLFISHKRSHIITKKEIQGGPDLVIEVLSPSTEERDRGYKERLYAREGVLEYWIVSPEGRTIEVFELTEKGFELLGIFCAVKEDALKSRVLEGLELPVQKIFE